jgi:hypothetical protein
MRAETQTEPSCSCTVIPAPTPRGGAWLPDSADADMSFVCPDFRGYGHATGPAPDAAPEAYCDRAMAQDVATLTRDLGNEDLVRRRTRPRSRCRIPPCPG